MDQIKNYSGKPTLYLDQNILDLLVKNSLENFETNLKVNFQIVYSDETLNEIKRSTGYESRFLDTLTRLDAHHLKVVFDQSGFIESDKATITRGDLFAAFEEQCNSHTDFGYVVDAMQQWPHSAIYYYQGTSTL